MSKAVFTFPLAQYREFTTSIDSFMLRVSDENTLSPEWIAAWKILNRMITKVLILERKWNGYKVTGINPTHMIRKDIDVLFRKNVRDMKPDEDAINYGIRVSNSFIEQIIKGLPFLGNTSFRAFNQNIRELLDAVIIKTKHGEITKLINEAEKHSDFITVGQFATNEMVGHYLFLKNAPKLLDRSIMMRYIQAYEEFYSVFEKDMVLTSCLLELRDERYRRPYKLVPVGPGTTTTDDCLGKISSFKIASNKILRNAHAHGNVETDISNQIVTIFAKGEPKSMLTFNEVIKYCEEISALILSFRLIVTQLSILDWIEVAHILGVPLNPDNFSRYPQC
jgi:hypothetical protein